MVVFTTITSRNHLIEKTVNGKIYVYERILLELEKLHVIEDQDGNLVELERTKKQRDILEALDKISWW